MTRLPSSFNHDTPQLETPGRLEDLSPWHIKGPFRVQVDRVMRLLQSSLVPTTWVLFGLLLFTPVSQAMPPSTATIASQEQNASSPLDSVVRGLERTLETARNSNQRAVVVFGAIWCAPCREFRAKTLPNPEVVAALDGYVFGVVDIDRHPDIAREYGVVATPTIVLFDADGTVLAKLQGDSGPATFASLLRGDWEGGDSADFPSNATSLIWTPSGFRGESICFSHVGYGPLRVSSQSIGNALRLSLEPRTPSTLLEGQYEVRWTETLTNYWAFSEDQYRLDFGTLHSQLALGYGLTDTVQVEVAVLDYRRFDSVLDGITNGFHSLFGLDDSGRDDFSDNENVIFLDAEGINAVDEDRYTEDLAFTLQHNLTCGTETLPALSWSLSARTNIGGNVELEGSNDLSLGFSLAAARRVSEKWYLYGSLGYVWHGQDRWRGLQLRDTQGSALIAAEYRYSPRAAWVFQALYTQEVARNIEPFDEPSFEIDIGWKKEISPGTVLELGLLENAFTVDTSPDVGFHFGLTHRF